MPKLGVYVASYNQPVFLRHCLLQILNQSVLPDVISIHENADSRSYYGVVEDVLANLEEREVSVVYTHTPTVFNTPEYFVKALQPLIDLDCELYQKIDVDDIVFDIHLLMQERLLEGCPNYDIGMNVNAGLLVLPIFGKYRHNPSVDFGIWNPTGAHPNNIIFRRNVAEAFLAELSNPSNRGMNDDAVFAARVMPNFRVLKKNLSPTSCFVAHGRNVSVAHWSTTPPPEAGE